MPWFCVIDPELDDIKPIGHYHIYDYTVCDAAKRRGYQTLILGRKTSNVGQLGETPVVPAFTHGIWRTAEVDNRKNGRHRGLMRAGWRFFQELRFTLAPFELKPNSIIFFQSVYVLQIFGLALFGIWCRYTEGPVSVILLRYQPELYKNLVAAIGFRILEKLVRAGNVRFVTDSRRLAAEYRILTKAPFDVLPIPHPRLEPSVRAVEPNARLRFGTLGGARGEKGINEIIDAIRLLNTDSRASDIEFVLHVHSPSADSMKKLTELKIQIPENVTLIEEPLDEAGYNALLYSLDVLILPYWRSTYRSRTSGPLVEAISAGKVVIVTRNTWLDEEMQGCGAGIACEDHSPVDLARAIVEVAGRYEELHALASARRPKASENDAADLLVTQIANLFFAPKIPDKRRSGVIIKKHSI